MFTDTRPDCDTRSGERVYPPPPVSEMTDILPEQTPPERPSAPEKGATDDIITTYPPLGQSTTISRHDSNVKLTVLLHASASSDGRPQVCLWHNQNGEHDWTELELQPSSAPSDELSPEQESTSSHHWYVGILSGVPKHGHVLSFTVKFRLNGEHDWQWIKDITGISDGQLHYQSRDYRKHSAYDLKHWFSGLSPDIHVQSEKSETDDTFLYSLSSSVKAATGRDSGYQYHQLGVPNDYTKWFATVRLWTPWLAPRQGEGKFSIDKDGVLLSFLRADGSHVVCLAISGIEDVLTTFQHDEHGHIIIKARNDRPEAGMSRVLVAVADSFEVANASVMYHARKVVKAYGAAVADDETKLLMDDNVKAEWLEEWYDGLTYCTWNGLGQDLTAQKIYDALDDLAKENINITNLIIDDNWQWLSKGETQFVRGWSSFEANPGGFPDGMKATTSEIRKRHPTVNHIAVWHALLGYWGGIDPHGEIAKKYKTISVEKEPGVAGGTFTVVAAEDAKRMYDDFYTFLSASGVDSVKTDAQFFLDLMVHAPDRAALTTCYQDAWTVAHLRHFGSRAISCMSQSPQILFYSQLPTNKPRLLVRNSDDFFPTIEASHPWHIFCNAHNSLLTQHLNVLPDWDMFQTSGKWSSFHAAARCVSGGPIYFTDEPGKHNFTLLEQMTARTIRNKTIILRPHTLGKSIDPYNMYPSAHALLKIGTYVGYARTGTGILGVFNVSNRNLKEFIPLHAFPGTEEGEYVVQSFKSDTFSQPMRQALAKPQQSTSQAAMVTASIPEGEWDILTAHPLRPFTLHSSKDKSPSTLSVANLGLRNKMTGAAAVTGYTAYIADNGRLRLWVQLKALGVLGLWISDLESRSVEEGFLVLLHGKPISVECVRRMLTKGKSGVLEIDVERAWKESGESPGWSNEVSLEVFVG